MPLIANSKYYYIKANGKYYDIYNPFRTFTLTINPTPVDATVTLTATGYTQVGNSITVRRGTTVSWSVSKTNYYTQTGSVIVDEDKTQSVSLVYALATLTISPTPSDATVTLSASGYSQIGNAITVEKGTSVSWSVSKSGYVTQSGTQTMSADETKSITLVLSQPLFRCYYNTFYYYIPPNSTTQVYANTSGDYVRATSSSELYLTSYRIDSISDTQAKITSGLGTLTYTRNTSYDLYT